MTTEGTVSRSKPTNYEEDYPDWKVWQTDDRFGRWHAAHKDNVGYYQGGNEADLKDYLDNYGKEK